MFRCACQSFPAPAGGRHGPGQSWETHMTALTSNKARQFAGTVAVPGDKSLSHRALMLTALAVGRSRVRGLLEGEDVLATARAMAALGAGVARGEDGVWTVDGVGVGGLGEPDDVIDLGNSGTGARLLMGLVAGHPMTCFFTGDASLRRRPMARVITPLQAMGAVVQTRAGGRLPLAVTGAQTPIAIDYAPPMASAQVKSAVLLAGLNAPGRTVVREAVATRDHTERLLAHMGADVRVQTDDDGARLITLDGQPDLAPADIVVPGDISSAAFPLVAGLLVPGGEVVVENVGVNPLRAGLPAALAAMGAAVEQRHARDVGGEPVADLAVTAGPLDAVDLDPALAPAMIDEFPVLFVAAACARGTSRFTGLAELRVKESDRLAAMATGLAANGVEVEELEDGLIVHGCGGPPPGGGRVETHLDHRIAMAFLVLGTVADKPVTIDDAGAIATSFPDFVPLMNGLGARMGPEGGESP